jgi:hypothetical protein
LKLEEVVEEVEYRRDAIDIRLRFPDGDVKSWSPEKLDFRVGPARLRRMAERELGAIQVAPELWRVKGYKNTINASDLFTLLSRRYPLEFLGEETLPNWLIEYIGSIEVHLIETQRLLSTVDRVGRVPVDEGHSRGNTAVEFSNDLARRIGDVLARNSRTSQQLDRTFPKRVLTGPSPDPEVTDDRIREVYKQQIALREALEEIADLDNEQDLPLPEEELEPWQRRVLLVYLEDTAEKLATFKWIVDRTNLLKEIVNSRFLNKRMIIDREQGFKFVTSAGHELDATQLSSGEQHELVLVYDLLFNVKEGSLVLIDEPEISLHVGWQQEFLSDIQRIAGLANLRFIVATHSPQIVHKWISQTVKLGPYASSEE